MAQDARPPSVVLRAAAQQSQPLGVGDVGAELLPAGAARAYRLPASAAVQQEEVRMEDFKRGAFLGAGAGLAAGALVGALLGGSRNQRVETAVPGALAGLAVGAPVGVYLQTGRPARYLWGAAGVVGAVAAGTAIYLAE